MQSWPSPVTPPLRITDDVDVVLGGRALPAGAVSLYVCGITPYDATHLGHARTFLAFDHLVRLLRATGRDLTYVQNVTDVDDPLLERAERDGVDWQELAASQVELYRDDMRELRVLPPDHFVGVVESVDLAAGAVARMTERGVAYPVPSEDAADDVYADLEADPDFRPGLPDDEALSTFAERGGDPSRPGKRGPLDPLLWRAARDGEPSWEVDGVVAGRPGWHIECAVIQERFLGGAPTITGGGSDLAFPHHPMSASHLRMLGHAGDPIRLHAGMLAYQGEKMSKSLGNLVFVSKLREAGVEASVIRLALAAMPWRDDVEWTDEMLETATVRLQLWRRAVARGGSSPHLARDIAAVLGTDLDVPGALGVVDDWAAERIAGERSAGGEAGAGAGTHGTGREAADIEAVNAIEALLGIAL